MLVDTHAHLNFPEFKDDLPEVLEKLRSSGVGLIINIGTDLKTSQEVVRLEAPSGIEFYSTVGIHPEEGSSTLADESIHKYIEELESIYNSTSNNIIGLGECGLDYHYPPYDQNSQMKLYKAQVELAKKLNLPLIIHCRDAWQDIFISELNGTTGVFHNFSGSKEDAQKALYMGYYLSFSCVVTYPKNQNLRDLIKDLPLDRILTETDCPYLPPQEIRGQRNDPSNIKQVVQIIAELKNLSLQQVEDHVLANTKKLFKL